MRDWDYAFPLNNTLTSIDESLSKIAQRLRWIELPIFITSMILLFAEISFFYQVLLFGIIVFGLHLITNDKLDETVQ